MRKKDKVLESILWSIALPGFGQFLNGKYIKAIVFILLEGIINIQSGFNEAIFYSFNGEISKAINIVDYQWIMFYPCLYFFAMWDAYKGAGGGREPYSYLPFVLAAFSVTIGIMYSDSIRFFGVQLGTMWFPMICVIPGVLIGIGLKRILNNF